MKARAATVEKDDLFSTIFTVETMRALVSYSELSRKDLSEEEIRQSATNSIQTLITTVEQFCAVIPAYVAEVRRQEDFNKLYEKVQTLLVIYRKFRRSETPLNANFDHTISPLWEAFAERQAKQPWFSRQVFEVKAQANDELVMVENEAPDALELLLSNLCREAHYSIESAINNNGVRKRDIAKTSLKGISIGLVAVTTLPPLAAAYCVVALPFSILTSIARREVGLWRSIRHAIPGALKIGPVYAYDEITEAVQARNKTRASVNAFTQHSQAALFALQPKAVNRQPITQLMSKITEACMATAENGMVPKEHLLTKNQAAVETALQGEAIANMIGDVIRSAESEVMIQTFAWENNTLFISKMREALEAVRARKEAGLDVKPLKVYVLIDERGRVANMAMYGHRGQKWPSDAESLGLINVPGLVEVHTGTFHHNSMGGTHAKTVVVDNKTLIITGANFQASNFGHLPAYDGAIKISGAIAQAARDDFRAIWNNSHNVQEGEAVAPPAELAVVAAEPTEHDVPMLFTTRRPSRVGRRTNNPQNAAFLAAINNTQSIIRIATPNLNSPDIKAALISFVARGGKLELLLGKGFNDQRESKPNAGGTNQQSVNEILEACKQVAADLCDIRWFSLDGRAPVIGNVAGAAHIKFMSADNEVVIFGNANMDVISANHLHECNVVIDSADITRQLTETFFVAPFARAIRAEQEVLRASSVIGTKQTLEIFKKEADAQGFQTFYFKKPENWNAQPGQYCEIRSGNRVSAMIKSAVSLAIASGADDDCIMFTGRAGDFILGSNHALKKSAGETLEITGPVGTCFPMELAFRRPLLLIGGGSGITVLRSIMHSLPDESAVQLIYSAKTAADLLYRDEVESWISNPFNYVTLTQEEHEDFNYGRFTDYLQQLVLPENPIVFICGPTELVKATALQLNDRGIPLDAIYGSLPTSALKGGPVYRADHTAMLGSRVSIDEGVESSLRMSGK